MFISKTSFKYGLKGFSLKIYFAFLNGLLFMYIYKDWFVSLYINFFGLNVPQNYWTDLHVKKRFTC